MAINIILMYIPKFEFTSAVMLFYGTTVPYFFVSMISHKKTAHLIAKSSVFKRTRAV
jgi:hypothetical protein